MMRAGTARRESALAGGERSVARRLVIGAYGCACARSLPVAIRATSAAFDQQLTIEPPLKGDTQAPRTTAPTAIR